MATRAKNNGRTSAMKGELARLYDRVTLVTQVFNESIGELRGDIKKIDDKLHALLEEGAVATMQDRLLRLEERAEIFHGCVPDIHKIKVEVATIDQRTKLLLYVGAAFFGPLAAWGIVTLLTKLFGLTL